MWSLVLKKESQTFKQPVAPVGVAGLELSCKETKYLYPNPQVSSCAATDAWIVSQFLQMMFK